MAEKKNKGRFTLQFNPADPQQMKAAELLEQQGRHKAQFLTSAVLHYIHCPETPDIAQPLHIDNRELEKRILEVLSKLPSEQLASVPKDKEKEAQAADAPGEAAGKEMEALFGPEVSSAIANTLSAFCRE